MKAIILLMCMGLFCGVAMADTKEVDIPFHIKENAMYVVMEVNGKHREMMLDTGSELTVMRTTSSAEGSPIQIDSATGHSLVRRCTVEIQLTDSHRFSMFGICGVNLPRNQEGLIGSDFLHHFDSVTIDYKNHVLRLIKEGE